MARRAMMKPLRPVKSGPKPRQSATLKIVAREAGVFGFNELLTEAADENEQQ